jgi:hypothetical protein
VGYIRDPRARWRRTDHEGMSGGSEPLPRTSDTPREIKVVFMPLRDQTLAAVIVRSRNGDSRWDRRDGVLQCEIGEAELEGLLPEQALRVLLRSALEALS